MRTVGEYRMMVRNQAGGAQAAGIYDPVQLHDALQQAMRDGVSLAVKWKSGRLLQHEDLDAIADGKSYRIPGNILAIAGVSAINSDGAEYPYNQVSFPARAQPGESYFGGGSYEGYWLEHRTIHVSPAPSTYSARSLRIYGWAIPPMPLSNDLPLPIPEEMERYVITTAVAEHLLPPPSQNVLEVATRQQRLAQAKFEEWLRYAIRDVNPAPVLEGGGAP